MQRNVVLHDWDMDRFMRTPDSVQRAFDLLKYAASRKTNLITSPSWVYEEKKMAALAVARLDKLLGIKSTWGLTQEVITRYPSLRDELQALGANDVRLHSHIKPDPKGEGSPLWEPPLVDFKDGDSDKLFDSHWPCAIKGQYIPWHIDYFHSNRQWLHYLQFLEEYLK